ncbi:hypothetical protein HYU23_01500 [Candidatus Woesearchaeota archaeon]|nr:hypothetical protein [Candidatus Woesearchaeota archaeon]
MEKELIDLGLNKNEAKIYINLLQLGPTTTGPLIKKTGIYRVILYDTLYKLISKGLVSFFVKNNRKNFVAEKPEKIVEIIKEKELIAQSLILKFKTITKKEDIKQSVLAYEGFSGIKSAQENYFIYMEKFKNKYNYLMFGASTSLHKKLDAYFNYFHNRRSKLNIKAKLVFNKDARKYGKLKAFYKLTQVKYMPENIITPSWISTYGPCLLIGLSEDIPLAFFIVNEKIAQSYRNYFDLIWNLAKK